ncbi:phenylacetate--CoA ligase family protein, partial [Jutongia huaianensis]
NVEDIKKLQSKLLVRLVKRMYINVPYYQKKLRNLGIDLEEIKGIGDIYKLPFMTKDDLKKAYPDKLLAVPKSECVRIQSTSGTTGKRVIAYYTKNDIEIWEECCARAIVAAGGDSQDVCQVSFGYGLFTGGAGMNGGAQKVGCLTLPMSIGNTKRQIQFMTDLNTTILCCTPSYAANLGEYIEKNDLLDKLSLKTGIFGAEPWTNEMRRELEKKLRINAYDIYGLTEIMGPGVAFECIQKDGMHIQEDHFYAEVVDPIDGHVLPEGALGELVLTSLTKQAFPLIRYRTRDLCKISRKKCLCGRTHIKMSKPIGRSDDMIIIKGVNVWPTQVEAVLLENGYSSNYLLEVDRTNCQDSLVIKVENDKKIRDEEIKKREIIKLENELRSTLGIRGTVVFVDIGVIKRSEGKSQRVIDHRKLY